MRVLICGDRNWTNKKLIKEHLEAILMDNKIKCVIQGEARGADTLGKRCAEELEIPVMSFPADWEKYGKSAGLIRNQQMLNEGKPDMVLAFHNDIKNSKGTKHIAAISSKANITVIIVNE